MAIRPAMAAARPISSLPAAPVDSARAPVDVPVAEPTAEPLGLGAAPVAVARVELEEESLEEPVPEAEAEAPVPLGLTLPVEVGTSVAVYALVHIQSRRASSQDRLHWCIIRTNFDTLTIADVCESTQSILCVVAAEAGDLGGNILGLADRLQVGRVGVLVDGAEEAARGRSDSELCKGEEGSSEDGLGEHVGGACRDFWWLRLVVVLGW